jgi:peptide/nickel transport system substrate-binding protein
MPKSILPLAALLAVVVATLVVGPAATASPDRASSGTVVFIHEQEPPNLQGPWVGNNLYSTALVLNNIWLGGQVFNDKGEYELRLFESSPKIVKQSPLTVQFRFKQNAVWSDGKPITCADWKATWQVFVNPANNVISRVGYEDVKSVGCAGKTATVVFKTRYADWESLVSQSPLYPAHVIAGKSMNEMFLDSVPVSSGPWKFQSWQKGVQITVVKNTKFTAGTPMKLDRVVFRYITDTNARFQALKAGEGQVMEPQAQLQIADFQKDKNFVVDSKAGYSYEHLDMQFGPKGAPALRQAYVRQAIITGINRPQIASALYQTIAPGLPTLQSLIFKTFEKGYQKNFAQYPFNQAKVISILKGKGCTGGPSKPSAGNSSIFSCPGVGKLSFRFSTTAGNQLRALTFEIIQLVPRFEPAGLLFGTTLPSSDWDIMMFGWVQTPASKITSKDLYACGGELDYMNYCNKSTSALLNKAAVTLDAGQRTKLLNQAEAIMAKDVPSIPMFVKPQFVIRSKKLLGPVVNPTNEGTPWNANTWRTTAS